MRKPSRAEKENVNLHQLRLFLAKNSKSQKESCYSPSSHCHRKKKHAFERLSFVIHLARSLIHCLTSEWSNFPIIRHLTEPKRLKPTPISAVLGILNKDAK